MYLSLKCCQNKDTLKRSPHCRKLFEYCCFSGTLLFCFSVNCTLAKACIIGIIRCFYFANFKQLRQLKKIFFPTCLLYLFAIYSQPAFHSNNNRVAFQNEGSTFFRFVTKNEFKFIGYVCTLSLVS